MTSFLAAYIPEIVNNVPLILLVAGILTFIYAIVRAKTPKGKTSGLEVILGVVMFIIGLLLPIVAALSFLDGLWGTFTIVLLILLSMTLVLGPIARIMKRIPALATAAIGALGVAYLVAVVLLAAVPIPPLLEPIIAPYAKWIMIAVFIIVAALSFMIILFARGLIEFFGLILGAWPVQIIIAIVCIAQGGFLLVGMSLLQFIEGLPFMPK
jgi:hypothetical protein